ncbi:MAG: Aminodeoxyfutalosine deaminase [Candidatus Heimdallarchaeota archaeon LC_3]|nr:MAG: Aminodeoxyfutalosine deaminase [Candidatus Heimdallarchaeota archaeon LC_3]
MNLISFIDLRNNFEGYLSLDYFNSIERFIETDSIEKIKKFFLNNEHNFSFPNIVKTLSYLTNFINSKEVFSYLCSFMFEKVKNERLLYTELVFSPQYYTINNFEFLDQIELLIETIKKTKLNIKLLINFIRNFGTKSAENYFNILKEYLDEESRFWIRGISLGGTEGSVQVQDFEKIFRDAHEENLLTTTVLGTTQNVKDSWDAVFSIQPDRITYGYNINNDFNLIRHFRATQTPIELSSSSFLMQKPIISTSIYPTKDHLFLEYFNSSFNVVSISDYSELYQSKIRNEIEYLRKIGFDESSVKEVVTSNAIKASFLTNYEKGELLLNI